MVGTPPAEHYSAVPRGTLAQVKNRFEAECQLASKINSVVGLERFLWTRRDPKKLMPAEPNHLIDRTKQNQVTGRTGFPDFHEFFQLSGIDFVARESFELRGLGV